MFAAGRCRPTRRRTKWLCSLVFGLLGLLLVGRGLAPAVPSLVASFGPQAAVDAEPECVTKPIREIRVGERVVTRGPGGESPAADSATAVDPSTWRLLRLHAEETWPDGTLDTIEIETLQPPAWVAEHAAEPGALVPPPVDLVEMGLPETLRATVVANEPCPEIAAGPGRVVLTTVNHLNPDVYDLVLEGADGRRQTVRPTGLHKFYSESRGGWVSAEDLRPGEQLRGVHGPITVAALRPLSGVRRVYNMTVEGEHVYRVAASGVLVHNTNCARALPPPSNVADHHIIPKFRGKSADYARFIEDRGIHVDDYCVTLAHGEASHHLKFIHGGGHWNQRWMHWIDTHPDATAKDIYQFAGQMMDEYGLSGLTIHPYGQ